METTLDIYKSILDDNEKLYLFIENYHLIINNIYSTEKLEEKRLVLNELNEIFLRETAEFKQLYLDYVNKMVKVHLHFEESWKEYESQIQKQYFLNFINGIDPNQKSDWFDKSSEELLMDASKGIEKPEEYDTYKSIDSFLRIPNYRFLLSLKDSLPENINSKVLHQIFDIYNSHKKGDLKNVLDDLVVFFRNNRNVTHNIDYLDVTIFLNKLDNTAVENEICKYLLGRYEDTVTIAEPIGQYIYNFIESKKNQDKRMRI
jgi:hypothetical protein